MFLEWGDVANEAGSMYMYMYGGCGIKCTVQLGVVGEC